MSHRSMAVIAWTTAGLALLWAVTVIFLGSGVDSGGAILLGGAGGAFLLAVLVANGVLWGAEWRRSGSRPPGLLATGLTLALVILAAYAALTNLPFNVRFELSRSSFEAAASQARAGLAPHTPATFGHIRVTRIERAGSEVYFQLADSGLAEGRSIVSSPKQDFGAPGDDSSVSSISRGWWLLTQD